MSRFIRLAEAEPVRLVAAVQALVAFVVIVLAQFDVGIAQEVSAAGIAAFAAFLGFVTRGQVTPA